jgi:hypothetical protein
LELYQNTVKISETVESIRRRDEPLDTIVLESECNRSFLLLIVAVILAPEASPMSKSPRSRKLKPLDPQSLSALKKRNDARVRRLVKSTRLNGRAAKRFAAQLKLVPEEIPDALLREIENAHRIVTGVTGASHLRKPKRT